MSTGSVRPSPAVELADVVVVGAGLAGLATAERLAAQGHDVLVLEAAERIGGRTRAVLVHDLILDGGGAYIGQLHTEIRALARRLGVAVQHTGADGASLFDRGGRLLRSDGPQAPYNALALGLALDGIDELADQINLRSPGSSPHAATQDNTTVREWLYAQETHPDAVLLIEQIVREMLATEPDEVSLLHFLFYVASGGGLPYLTAFASGAQEFRFVGGAHTLAERLAARLAQRIRTRQPVRRVTQTATSLQVYAERLTVECEHVVLATGPGPERFIDLEVPQPDRSAIPVPACGATVKLHFLYPSPFWRERGLSGWVTADRPPLRFLVDDSNGRGGVGVLVGFLTGEEARAWSGGAVKQHELTTRIAEWLGADALSPLQVLAQDWLRDPWVQGCYAAVPSLGGWTRARPISSARPWGTTSRVHRVGTEYSPYFYGHMEGAVRSARAVAEEIDDAVGAYQGGTQ